MGTAYYSTVLDHDVGTTWSLIRDFNNYPVYIDGVSESVIEDGRSGDEVGAVRRFCYKGAWIRQRLSAHSDDRRTLTYAGLEPFPFPAGVVDETLPPSDYEGTIRLLPVIDGARTFIEWSVTVDAAPEHAASWQALLMALIPDWTSSLRATLDRQVPATPRSGPAIPVR